MAPLLHGHPWSSNVQKVRFLLAELGLAYELRAVPFGLERPAWHLAANPLGGMPAYVDGDFVLAESNAILRYLAATAGRDDLYPPERRERARVDWLLDAVSMSLRPIAIRVEAAAYGLRPRRGLGAEAPDPGGGVTELARALPEFRRFAALLGQPPFAVAGRFTLVDVAAAPMLHRLVRTRLDLTGLERYVTWADAVLSRSSWSPVAAEAGV